jgi:hypothetical protein
MSCLKAAPLLEFLRICFRKTAESLSQDMDVAFSPQTGVPT